MPAERRGPRVRGLPASAEVGELLEEISTGAEHLSRIVSGVRPLAYSADQSLTEVDLHAGLEQALVLLRHKIPPGVSVVREPHPTPSPSRAGRRTWRMVWTNLLDNAVAAVGDEGTDHRPHPRAPGTGASWTSRTPARRSRRRSSSGSSTLLHHQARSASGTGLGLTTSLAVVAQQHHGELTLGSADGVTRARVVLPRGDDARGAVTAGRPPAGPAAGR